MKKMNEQTKIAVLQTQISVLDKNVNKIMSNDLPHIYEELGRVNSKLDDNFLELTKELAKLRTNLAYYVGIAVGAIAIVQVILFYAHK